jgi:hypothetical protein
MKDKQRHTESYLEVPKRSLAWLKYSQKAREIGCYSMDCIDKDVKDSSQLPCCIKSITNIENFLTRGTKADLSRRTLCSRVTWIISSPLRESFQNYCLLGCDDAELNINSKCDTGGWLRFSSPGMQRCVYGKEWISFRKAVLFPSSGSISPRRVTSRSWTWKYYAPPQRR